MKTKIIFTLSLIFSFSTLFAQDAGIKLEHDFSKKELTSENMFAFENRAKQKVIDFCNYIELISNEAYDEKLKSPFKKNSP